MRINSIQTTSQQSIATKARITIPRINMPPEIAVAEEKAGNIIAKELEKLGDVAKAREILDRNIYNGRCHYVHGINEGMSKEFAEKVYAKV